MLPIDDNVQVFLWKGWTGPLVLCILCLDLMRPGAQAAQYCSSTLPLHPGQLHSDQGRQAKVPFQNSRTKLNPGPNLLKGQKKKKKN